MKKISLETIINFYKKIPELLKTFFKSEGFKIGAIIFSCLFAFVIVFPSFLDTSKLKYDLTQRLSKLTQSTISIRGNLEISLLPSPSITVHDVFIENYALSNKRSESDNFYNIYAKDLKIIFPIFRTNSRQLIKKISANEAIIEIAQPEILKKIENGDFAKTLENFQKTPAPVTQNAPSGGDISSILFPINDMETVAIGLAINPSLQLNDSKITFYNEYGTSKEIININSRITYTENIIDGYGFFISQGIENEFKISAKFNQNKKEKNTSFFSLNSPAFNLKISGNFLEKNLNGPLKTKFSGLLECEIYELRSFYRSIISKSDLFSSKLRYNGEKIKLTSELDSDGKNIDLKNILINSNVLNGIGKIYLGLSEKIFTADINLDIDDINLDEIWSTENPAKKIAKEKEKAKLIENAQIKAEESSPKDEEKKVVIKSPILKVKKRNISDLILEARDYDINLEILIKNANLYEGKVEDIKLYGSIANDNKALLSPLSFKLPGNSEFRISGVFEESEMNSKFQGSVDGKGDSLNELFKWLQLSSNNIKMENLKNYNFYSDLEVSPININLKNFYVNLNDKKTEFFGNLVLNDKEKSRSVLTNIKVSEFDFDKYISIPIDNIYFNEGILFDKLLWLNQVYSDYSININFENLKYQNQEFKDQNINLNFGQGYFKFPKSHFASADNIFDLEFNVDISDKNQIGNIALSAEKIKLKLHEDAQNSETTIHSTSLFDKFYKLPSLQGFTGNIDITAKEINLDDKLISEFDYKNSLKNGIFGQSKLLMKIYDGDFEYKGLCDIKYNKIINGLFSCKSCNLKKILDDFYNVKSIDGVANISGNIVGIAKSVEEFKNKIDSEISIAISAPKIDGYGLTDLVKKMFSIKEFANELSEPEKVLENPQSSTQFLQGKGFVRLRGEKNSNFSISLSAPAMNSIFSGIIFLNDESINGTLNTIFLSGSKEKKIPINIATNVVGFFDDVGYVSNLNQARQYLGLERINNQELNNKLLTQSEEKKIAKKNKIAKKYKSSTEEEVTTENQIIEETQIIEINKPEDIKNTNTSQNATNENAEKSTTTSAEETNTKTQIIENNSSSEDKNIKNTSNKSENSDNVVQPSF